jgi:hypothetical protein
MHAIVVRSTLHDYDQAINFLRKEDIARDEAGSRVRDCALGEVDGEDRHIDARVRIRRGSAGRRGATKGKPASRSHD